MKVSKVMMKERRPMEVVFASPCGHELFLHLRARRTRERSRVADSITTRHTRHQRSRYFVRVSKVMKSARWSWCSGRTVDRDFDRPAHRECVADSHATSRPTWRQNSRSFVRVSTVQKNGQSTRFFRCTVARSDDRSKNILKNREGSPAIGVN